MKEGLFRAVTWIMCIGMVTAIPMTHGQTLGDGWWTRKDAPENAAENKPPAVKKEKKAKKARKADPAPVAAVSPAPTIAAQPTASSRSALPSVEAIDGWSTARVQELQKTTGRALGMDVGLKECAECPEIIIIPAGSFEMGSPASETGRKSDEGPQHRVTIRKAFTLGKYEVTVGEFRRFVQATNYRTDAETNAGGKEGCRTLEDSKWDWRKGRYWDNTGFSQGDRQPVACLSWNDVQDYVQWLARKTGKPYRLPSEAEWEYAARAGTTSSGPWGDSPDQACRYANVTDITKGPNGSGWSNNNKHDCSDGYFFSAPVGTYEANAFGLHDMIGNVAEWTEDCSHDSYSGAPTDGSAWTSKGCGTRVLRGGSWSNFPGFLRSAFRLWIAPDSRSNYGGFRIARTLP